MILRALPLTPSRWSAFERLFGARGACAGCWCMWPRRSAGEFARGKGAGNRRALRALVSGGGRPGLIAFAGGEAVGWVALAPRAHYPRLAASRVMAPVDDAPVWSVVCFFIARQWRGRGVTEFLLEAAKRYAARRGARVLEGYPNDAGGARMADTFAWFGLSGAFERTGFIEVARRSPSRPIMRCALAPAKRAARTPRPAVPVSRTRRTPRVAPRARRAAAPRRG